MTTAKATEGGVAPEVQSEPTPWEKLRAPFPPEKIGHISKGGVELGYVGHADVTDRLLAVDPYWNWEPLSTLENGLPRFVLNEQDRPVGLWIKLTIHHAVEGDISLGFVTRLGYGSVSPTAFDPEKQLIGDALRNAAMRFGVGLDLWRKEEVAPTESASTVTAEVRRTFAPTSSPQAAQPATAPSGSKGKVPCALCAADDMKNKKGYPAVFWSDSKTCDGGWRDAEDGFHYVNHPLVQEPQLTGVGAAVSAEADRVPLEAYDDGSSVPF